MRPESIVRVTKALGALCMPSLVGSICRVKSVSNGSYGVTVTLLDSANPEGFPHGSTQCFMPDELEAL